MTIYRILKFFRQYFLKHPIYVIAYGATYFKKDFKFDTHFYSADEIVLLLREGKSLIRLGDGEVSLLLDLKNHCYQKFSPKVKSMLREIITSYSSRSPYILAIPRFVNFSNTELKEMGKLNVWMPLKVMFVLMFPPKVSYMDAHSFYYDQYFENILAPIFKDKIALCITKKETIERLRNNPAVPFGSIHYIETPDRDALDQYKAIKEAVDGVLANLSAKDVVLFVAMGPAGKYLIFEYANKGYQCIDVGRGLEVAFTSESIEHLI